MWWRLGLLAIVGCGRLGFDPGGAGGDDTPGGGDGGTNGDGSMDAPAPLCPTVSCAFSGVVPCSCFGSPSVVGGGLTEANGALEIMPIANAAGSQIGCVRSDTALGLGGVSVEVSRVIDGVEGYTALRLGEGGDVYQLGVSNGMLISSDASGELKAMPYFQSMMRWWRIRPLGGGITYEYSFDGVSWATQATSSLAPSPVYFAWIVGGTTAPEPAPGLALIETINLCGPS